MDFFAVSFRQSDVAMHTIFFLTSLKPILLPNCILLYLHSFQFEKFLDKKKNCYKKRNPQIKSAINQLKDLLHAIPTLSI